jgi:hypothetical protein
LACDWLEVEEPWPEEINMFSVETDRSKRLLVIGVAGHVTQQDVREAAQEVRKVLESVAPGFRALTDFRWLESIHPSAAPHIADIMKAIVEKQVGLVISVVSDPGKDVVLNVLSNFSYGSEVQIVTFEKLADAMEKLMEEDRKLVKDERAT